MHCSLNFLHFVHISQIQNRFRCSLNRVFLSPVLGRAPGATEWGQGVPAGPGDPGGGGAVAGLLLAILGPDGSRLHSQPFLALWLSLLSPALSSRLLRLHLRISSLPHGY